MVLFRFLESSLSPAFSYFLVITATCGMAVGSLFQRRIRAKNLNQGQWCLLSGLAAFLSFHLAEALFLWPLLLATLFIFFLFLGSLLTAVLIKPELSFRRLYLADLIGCAAGVLISQFLLIFLDPFQCLLVFLAVLSVALILENDFSVQKAIVFNSILAVFWMTPMPFIPSPERSAHHAQVQDYEKHGWILEKTLWSPTSRLDLFKVGPKKEVFFDSGTLQTTLYPFDGDFQSLKSALPERLSEEFWSPGVVLPYYLKQGPQRRTFIIGGGGGQETKAALLYGYDHIEVTDLEAPLLNLLHGPEAEWTGGIFNHPAVQTVATEGRTFLQTKPRGSFDVIQLFSAHTSSALASGGFGIRPSFLVTENAFRDYFERLKSDGILQISHTFFPRLIVTAAAAWKGLGKTDFRSHVLIFDTPDLEDRVASVFIKMSPWTPEEIHQARDFFALSGDYRMVENPLSSSPSFLSSLHFEGKSDPRTPYDLSATSDDRPYFKFLHLSLFQTSRLSADAGPMTQRLKSYLKRKSFFGVPEDIGFLLMTGFSTFSLLLISLWILAPKGSWKTRQMAIRTSGIQFVSGFSFSLIQFSLFLLCSAWIGHPSKSLIVAFASLLAGISLSLIMLQPSRKLAAILGLAGLLFIGAFQSDGFLSDWLKSTGSMARMSILASGIFGLGFCFSSPLTLIAERWQRTDLNEFYFANSFGMIFGGFAAVLGTLQSGLTSVFLAGLALHLTVLLIITGTSPKET